MAHRPYLSSKFHELYHRKVTNSTTKQSRTVSYRAADEARARRIALIYHLNSTNSIINTSRNPPKKSRTVSYRAADEAHRSYLRSKSHQLYHQYVMKSMIWMSQTPSYISVIHRPGLPSKSHELYHPDVMHIIIRMTRSASYRNYAHRTCL